MSKQNLINTTVDNVDLIRSDDSSIKNKPIEVYMGIDIGSVSLKIVLIDEDRNIIEKLWLRNQGSPIESSKTGLKKLKEKLESNNLLERIKIVGVGTTGSARYLIKSVIGGDICRTEIISHAIAASIFYPDVKTILEIGGQDSKIIILREGIVSDFAMNSVCAAGTGSFLDHQAQRLGIPIEKFGEYALRSTTEVNIAGRCGVFAESDMIHKAQMGYSKEDIIKGLCDALVRNYLNNVGKGKEIKAPIVFQGGVSYNKGLVKSFQESLGHEILVPKHNILMGAIGAAVLVMEETKRMKRENSTWKSNFRGFELLDFNFRTKAFRCKGCPNRCEVVSVFMKTGELNKKGDLKEELVARWGDRCGKWAVF